ncbi:MAG TPA: HAD family hydrolase [Steroidobacteraceae bacterium]
MKPIQLVIFDCDGVLVDSEPITNSVFAQMLGELGISLTLPDMYERFVGQSTARCCELIAAMLGRPVPHGFIADYRARSDAALASQLKSVPGIEATLDALDRMGMRYCVASNGTHEKMRTTLGITGLLARFEGRLFAITDVARGKPAPDLFLLAAASHGVPAASCVVIEDTPTGVIAGVAAGMPVYGYCALTSEHRLVQVGARVCFTDMRALPELLLAAAT